MKMEKVIQLVVFVGLTDSFVNAEFTAENVYDFLSRRLDNVNMELTEIKKMFEDFKLEINTKFADLKEKVDETVQIYDREEMSSFSNQASRLNRNKQTSENERTHLKKHFLGLQKSMSAEKHFIRNAINMFQVRVEDVEQKMIAFENASWKGEKGDVGHPGTPGPSGEKGSKGEKGLKGEIGYKGSMGVKGQKGSPETRKPNVYFHVSLSTDQTLPELRVIKFDKVFTNQGGKYDSSTGIFTAPYSGVYLFLFSVRVGSGKYDIAYVNLYVDGVFRAYAIDEAVMDSHDTMAANAYVTRMDAGDKAWIQTGDITNKSYHKMKNSGTTFTGIMLY